MTKPVGETTRRSIVSFLAAAPVFLSGCASVSPIGEGQIVIENHKSRDVDLKVTIQDGGETVFEKTYSVEAAGTRAQISTDTPLNNVLRGSQYDVVAQLRDSRPVSTTFTIDCLQATDETPAGTDRLYIVIGGQENDGITFLDRSC